jgi:hypothetical protein
MSREAANAERHVITKLIAMYLLLPFLSCRGISRNTKRP